MVSTVQKEIFTHTESLLKQKHPKNHGHYRFQDFFAFDRQFGTINDWNESRNIFTSEDFIIGLVEGLEEEVPSFLCHHVYYWLSVGAARFGILSKMV